jgi:hypothetical protein
MRENSLTQRRVRLSGSQQPESSFSDGKRQKEDPIGTAFLLAFPARLMFNLQFQHAILGAVISG